MMQPPARRLRILLYGINYAPELTGIGKYTGEMAEWLAARGHEVHVVTAPPYYPAWQVGPGYRANQWRHEVRAGVQVWRCPLWVPARPSGLKRLLHLASFAASSTPVVLRQAFWRPHVALVVEPALFCAPTAWLAARLGGAQAWLHVQDYEVDAAFEMGLLKGQALRRLVAGGESWLMRRFDAVSSISGRMVDRARDKGVAPNRLVHFPNWVDVSAITPLNGPSTYRAELGLPEGAAVALYSGNMGNKQGLEVLAEVARRLQAQRHLRFVFCGEGAGRPALEQASAGLDNVHFLPLQPLARLGDLLGLATVHLLPQKAGAADLVLPSKLTGMLASGRPVLATAAPGTELASVITERAACGRIVPAEDAAAMAQALQAMLADLPALDRMGAAGRRYAEQAMSRDGVLLQLERDMLARSKL